MPRNMDEMIKLIHKAWKGIFKEILTYSLPPYRMHVVIVANGDSTR